MSKSALTELLTLTTDYTLKQQLLMVGRQVKEFSQTIYVYEDIGLDFTWQSNSENSLLFSFSCN